MHRLSRMFIGVITVLLVIGIAYTFFVEGQIAIGAALVALGAFRAALLVREGLAISREPAERPPERRRPPPPPPISEPPPPDA